MAPPISEFCICHTSGNLKPGNAGRVLAGLSALWAVHRNTVPQLTSETCDYLVDTLHSNKSLPKRHENISLLVVSYLILSTNTTVNQPAPGKARLGCIMLHSCWFFLVLSEIPWGNVNWVFIISKMGKVFLSNFQYQRCLVQDFSQVETKQS